MKDFTLLSAAEILGISIPENLFVVDTEKDVKTVYRKLSAIWHPDKHIVDGLDTTNVFAHIQSLYEKALKKFQDGEWKKGNVLRIKDVSGAEFEFKYLVERPFEYGVSFIAKGFIAFSFNLSDELAVKQAIKNISGLKYANDKMREEVKKYLPELVKTIKTEKNIVLVVKKDPCSISLRDVLTYYNGFVDPKHVAWILSGMYNIACFNQYNNLMQAGFSLDNYYINPEKHLGQILGGWWFSQKNGDSLIALSTEAVNVAPIKMLNNKKADISLDLELIKLVGRQLLGDSSGIKFRKDSRIPKDLSNWLTDSNVLKPYEAYRLWQEEVLIKSFGVRRFTKMEVKINDIFN